MGTAAPYIGVVGPGEAGLDVLAVAEDVGRGLARAQAVLVCGGLGGAMEAACRGAQAEGGRTVGILPGLSRRDGNAYLDVALATGVGEMRNTLIVRASDAIIALAGEFGTLSEISFALKTGVPVVGVDTWELSKGGRFDDTIVRADSAESAVQVALRLAVGA